jgi:hypothetical protein
MKLFWLLKPRTTEAQRTTVTETRTKMTIIKEDEKILLGRSPRKLLTFQDNSPPGTNMIMKKSYYSYGARPMPTNFNSISVILNDNRSTWNSHGETRSSISYQNHVYAWMKRQSDWTNWYNLSQNQNVHKARLTYCTTVVLCIDEWW